MGRPALPLTGRCCREGGSVCMHSSACLSAPRPADKSCCISQCCQTHGLSRFLRCLRSMLLVCPFALTASADSDSEQGKPVGLELCSTAKLHAGSHSSNRLISIDDCQADSRRLKAIPVAQQSGMRKMTVILKVQQSPHRSYEQRLGAHQRQPSWGQLLGLGCQAWLSLWAARALVPLQRCWLFFSSVCSSSDS